VRDWLDHLKECGNLRIKTRAEGEALLRFREHVLAEFGGLDVRDFNRLRVRVARARGVAVDDLDTMLATDFVDAVLCHANHGSTTGPVAPDKFRWGQREVRGLSMHQWRLLEALCQEGRLRNAVPTAQVIRHVYGEKANERRRRALDQLRRRTQEKLDAAGVGLLIDLTNQSYRLTPI
jgi:hypothetical protein